MLKKIVCLLAISSVAQSDPLKDLIDSSTDIVNQIQRGIKLTGAATEYAHQGNGLSDGTLSSTAHISSDQVDSYNSALLNFSDNYQPYGAPVKEVLENMAMDSLAEMENHVDTFVEVTVDLVSVQQVAEKAVEASTPKQEEEVQTFVSQNQEMLTIDQNDIDTYNTSLDEIESSANEAAVYLSVANSEAATYLQQSVEDANTTTDNVNIFYDSNAQWLAMGYNTTRNLTVVMLNGNDSFGLDMYYSEADILALGAESEFFITSPMGMGYNCFFEMDCEQ